MGFEDTFGYSEELGPDRIVKIIDVMSLRRTCKEQIASLYVLDFAIGANAKNLFSIPFFFGKLPPGIVFGKARNRT
jgi:hypothetical protein